MKKILACFFVSISIAMFLLVNVCQAQNLQLSQIKRSFDLTTSSTGLVSNGSKYEFQIPYYELSVSDVQFGLAAVFAISKEYPQQWVDDARINSKKECDSLKCGPIGYVFCEARRLFEKDTVQLKKIFDLYLFVIEKKELDGPFEEEGDAGIGTIEYYTPKIGSTLITYLYENGRWREINRKKQIGENSPRVLGREIVDKIAIEKINLWLQKK